MIDLLVPGSVTTQPGSNPSTGAYFLVVICSRETQDGALKELEQQAREEIASFLGAKVSSKSSASTGSNYTEVEGKEAVEYFQTISKSTEVEIDQVIAGQVLVSMKRSSTSCSVAYAVTEKDAQRTKDLARAMARREEIGAVTGVGVAIDRGEGEASALQIAERRAVENAVRSVAGVSMTSRELRVNGDVVARAAASTRAVRSASTRSSGGPTRRASPRSRSWPRSSPRGSSRMSGSTSSSSACRASP